jgi:hypothetical protein
MAPYRNIDIDALRPTTHRIRIGSNLRVVEDTGVAGVIFGPLIPGVSAVSFR